MTTYTIDTQHSDVGFSVRHMVFAKVRGHFTKWTAELAFDPADPAKSSVSVDIDVASIDTREAQRDGHLKSPDFLDAEKYPKLTYKSTKVEKAGDKKYAVTGDLTIHGVTKPVSSTSKSSAAARTPGQPARGLLGEGADRSRRVRAEVEPGARDRRRPRRRAHRHRD